MRKHAFVPGDLVRWATGGENMPKEWQLGIVIGSLGGREEDVTNDPSKVADLNEKWFRVTVFWMPCHDLKARFDSHPISALRLV